MDKMAEDDLEFEMESAAWAQQDQEEQRRREAEELSRDPGYLNFLDKLNLQDT